MNWTLNVAAQTSLHAERLAELRPEFDPELASGGIVEARIEPALIIPDFDFTGIDSTLTVAQAGKVRYLEVELDIEHTYVGDLQIELVAPSKFAVRLHDRARGWQRDLQRIYSMRSCPALADMYAQSISGTWHLRIRDIAQVDEGRLRTWGLKIWH